MQTNVFGGEDVAISMTSLTREDSSHDDVATDVMRAHESLHDDPFQGDNPFKDEPSLVSVSDPFDVSADVTAPVTPLDFDANLSSSSASVSRSTSSHDPFTPMSARSSVVTSPPACDVETGALGFEDSFTAKPCNVTVVVTRADDVIPETPALPSTDATSSLDGDRVSSARSPPAAGAQCMRMSGTHDVIRRVNALSFANSFCSRKIYIFREHN